MAEPMPFDLWWSPSMHRFLTRHEGGGDEHLVWVVEVSHRSLRNVLGIGGAGDDINPPLPDDAVRLVPASGETCGAWDGCTQPVGHNQGQADIPENHGPFWQGLAEYWEREHQNAVLPYTTELESERDAAQAKLDQIRAIAEEAPEPRGALRRRLLAVLDGDAP